MLLFFCAADQDLATLRREGAAPARLWPSLREVESACGGPVLVVETSVLGDTEAALHGARHVEIPALEAGAFLNLDPYLPPAPVYAGGGIVARLGEAGPEVLLIYRRGRWDLPKGKQDPGETIAACAMREVREEIGVKDLRRIRALGTTRHGYAEDHRYRVKTTHWYLMTTTATRFKPEAREGIRKVAWTPWAEAVDKVGFETLRRLLERVEPDIRAAL